MSRPDAFILQTLKMDSAFYATSSTLTMATITLLIIRDFWFCDVVILSVTNSLIIAFYLSDGTMHA